MFGFLNSAIEIAIPQSIPIANKKKQKCVENAFVRSTGFLSWMLRMTPYWPTPKHILKKDKMRDAMEIRNSIATDVGKCICGKTKGTSSGVSFPVGFSTVSILCDVEIEPGSSLFNLKLHKSET